MKESTLHVVIVTCGEPQFEKCIESVRNQTRKADKIDIIENVSPMSAAFNQALDMMDCEYGIILDADMILNPDALEIMLDAIKSAPDNVFGVFFQLNDPYYGRIGHVKILRSKIVKLSRFPDKPFCDRLMADRLKEKGYYYITKDDIAGTHCANPTPEQLFKKGMGTSVKVNHSRNKWTIDNQIKSVARKWIEGDKAALAGLIGFFNGLAIDRKEKERDFAEFGKKEWEKVRWVFEDLKK